MQNHDFVILTVSVGETHDKVQTFTNNCSYAFKVLLDSKFELPAAYGVKGIPATFIIDKKGTLIAQALGPRKWAGSESITLFKTLSKQ